MASAVLDLRSSSTLESLRRRTEGATSRGSDSGNHPFPGIQALPSGRSVNSADPLPFPPPGSLRSHSSLCHLAGPIRWGAQSIVPVRRCSRERTDHGLCEPFELPEWHANRLAVSSRVEYNLLILSK